MPEGAVADMPIRGEGESAVACSTSVNILVHCIDLMVAGLLLASMDSTNGEFLSNGSLL